jgi:hypothetical protein
MTYFSSPWLYSRNGFLRAGMFSSSHPCRNCRARDGREGQESISQTRSEIVRGVVCVKNLAGKQQSKVGTQGGSSYGSTAETMYFTVSPRIFPRSRTKWSQNLANTITMAVITEISQDGVLIAEIAPAEFA